MRSKLDRGIPSSVYELRQETLFRKAEGFKPAKIVVPPQLVPQLLQIFHDHPLSGNRGRTTTYTRIQANIITQKCILWSGIMLRIMVYVKDIKAGTPRNQG